MRVDILFSRLFLSIAIGSFGGATVVAQSANESGQQIVNGIAHSQLYASADFATRVNDCIADAANGTAASHICDSSGEASKQVISHQINIGNKADAWVTWIHGGNCTWAVRMSGGKDYALYQYSGSRVYGASQQRKGCELTNESPDGGIAGLYKNDGGGYYQFGDFAFRDTVGRMTGRGVVQISGAYDNSYYHDLTILNYLPETIGLFIGGAGPCCSLMMERISIGGNDTGGTLLDIEGHGANESPGIWFFNSSFGHPAKGKPIVRCHDTGSAYLTSVGFFGAYEEIAGPLAGTALNQVDGCVSVFAHGLTIEAVHGPATHQVPAWSFTGAFPTAVDITNMTMNHGFGLPNPAIVGLHGGTIYTDHAGNLASYTSNIAYADSIGLPRVTPPDHAACTPGSVLGSDDNYIYVCTRSGTVKRASLSSY